MNNTPLFNINAMIGNGAYEEAQFPNAASLVKHLDYLGIDRSLVTHVEARDLNPTCENRRLLREIETSSCSDRLIPAFVISPSCYYENGALAFLKENLGSDTFGHDLAWELGRYLSMPVPDKQLIPGLGENFDKILKKSNRMQSTWMSIE